MDKFKKYIFVFSCLVITFSLLCIPVSAATSSTGSYDGNTIFVSMPISQPTISDNFAYVEVILQDSRNGSYSAGVYLISANSLSVDSDTPSIQVNVSSFSNNQQSISFVPKASSSFDYRIFFVNASGNYWDLGVSKPGYNVVDTHTYNSVVSIRYYGFALDDGNSIINSSVSSLFNVAYGTDYVNTVLLNRILESLHDKTAVEDAIDDAASSISGSVSDSADQMQHTMDENTQSQIENANENTDKLANGWENEVEVESGNTSDLEGAEQGFINDNQQQFDSELSEASDNVFVSIRRLMSSFGAVSTLFRQLSVRVPDSNILIYFSLIIGIVPMIVGASINGLRSADRASARSREDSAYKRGYNSGFKRGKGG